MEVDDAKVFKILDLEDIEKTFSAYQRQQVGRRTAGPRTTQFERLKISSIYVRVNTCMFAELRCLNFLHLFTFKVLFIIYCMSFCSKSLTFLYLLN